MPKEGNRPKSGLVGHMGPDIRARILRIGPESIHRIEKTDTVSVIVPLLKSYGR